MKIRKVGTRTATQNITQDSKPVAISVEGNVLAIVQLLVENTVRYKVIKIHQGIPIPQSNFRDD